MTDNWYGLCCKTAVRTENAILSAFHPKTKQNNESHIFVSCRVASLVATTSATQSRHLMEPAVAFFYRRTSSRRIQMPWDDFNPVGAHKSSQSDHDFRVDWHISTLDLVDIIYFNIISTLMLKKNDIETKTRWEISPGNQITWECHGLAVDSTSWSRGPLVLL